jgi:hypothetical protein
MIAVGVLASLIGDSQAASRPPGCPQSRTEKGIPVIRNPRKPVLVPGRPGILRLVDELTIGRGGDENCQFGELRSAQVDSEGRIYALDGKDCAIKVFDPDGRFVAQFSLGPEEFSMQARAGKLLTLVREDVEGIPLIKRYAIVWE